MLIHVPYASLGQADYGWLQARYHFSFGEYDNPARRGFGSLRVINDDVIAPGKGFPPHPHKNMEIITYVRTGEVTHEDSLGSKGVVRAGDVQVMSAGTGVVHSEYNLGDQPLTLYQIWIIPEQAGGTPGHALESFPRRHTAGALPCLVSGFAEDQAEGALPLGARAALFGGVIPAGKTATVRTRGGAYLLTSKGSVEITDGRGSSLRMEKGDGAACAQNGVTLSLKAVTDAELLCIDVPGL